MKIIFLLMFFLLQATSHSASAAKENSSTKAIKKLQAMLQDSNSEKERLTAENAKLSGEIDQLKKEAEKNKTEKTAMLSKEQKLNSEITAQKQFTDEYRKRLEEATTKIHEIIGKYNALNQSNNELNQTHEQLKSVQQKTEAELMRCDNNNVKMLDAAKTVIKGYENCQNKNALDLLLDSEPFTGIKSVEFEKIAQEYEDKLRKQKYLKIETSGAK